MHLIRRVALAKIEEKFHKINFAVTSDAIQGAAYRGSRDI